MSHFSHARRCVLSAAVTSLGGEWGSLNISQIPEGQSEPCPDQCRAHRCSQGEEGEEWGRQGGAVGRAADNRGCVVCMNMGIWSRGG